MNDLRIVNLATYTTPNIVEKPYQDWIAYGEDNNYFQYLIDRYNGSPTNSACMNAISEMIYGKGLDALDSNRKPEAAARLFLHSLAPRGQEDVQQAASRTPNPFAGTPVRTRTTSAVCRAASFDNLFGHLQSQL